jgi:5-methylcytosine-specific restriction endonuclease McrA
MRETRINFEKLLSLVYAVPHGLYQETSTIKKGFVPIKLREEITKRDKLTCQICGLVDTYGCINPYITLEGKLQIHHIIPNGKSSLENLITLCKDCHAVVHLLLYIDGRWRKHTIR